MKLIVLLSWIAVVSSFPQSGTNLCGTDERGILRQVGDTWMEDCNDCRCTDNLVAGCTRRFCGVPGLPSSTTSDPRRSGASGSNLCGTDERGILRQVGDTWKEDCNTCRCTDNLVPGCTRRFCGVPSLSSSTTTVPRRSGAGAGGVQFPGASRGEPEVAPVPHCTDRDGKRREVGDSWNEDCNNCSCGKTGKSFCTLRFCVSRPRDVFLFTVDTSKNTDDIRQCRAEGAKNCKVVQLNHQVLSSSEFLSSPKVLKLFPKSDVELELKRGPEDLNTPTLSYVFSVTGGGEGSLTFRKSTLATYGSIKPPGSVHYTVESCGDGCNVMYERASDFFNNFQD